MRLQAWGGEKHRGEGPLSHQVRQYIPSHDLHWCHEPELPGQGWACQLSPPWHCLSRLGYYKSSWGPASTQAGAGHSSTFVSRVHFIIWGSWRGDLFLSTLYALARTCIYYVPWLCVYSDACSLAHIIFSSSEMRSLSACPVLHWHAPTSFYLF